VTSYSAIFICSKPPKTGYQLSPAGFIRYCDSDYDSYRMSHTLWLTNDNHNYFRLEHIGCFGMEWSMEHSSHVRSQNILIHSFNRNRFKNYIIYYILYYIHVYYIVYNLYNNKISWKCKKKGHWLSGLRNKLKISAAEAPNATKAAADSCCGNKPYRHLELNE